MVEVELSGRLTEGRWLIGSLRRSRVDSAAAHSVSELLARQGVLVSDKGFIKQLDREGLAHLVAAK